MALNSLGRPLPKTVKETVDFAYEMLIPHKDGIVFTTKKLGVNEARSFSTLVKRGIISKTPCARKEGRGCEYKYKWLAPMAPTKVLYGSIVEEIRGIDRAKYTAGKKSEKKEAPVAAPANVDERHDEPAPEVVEEVVAAPANAKEQPAPAKTFVTDLQGFSSQELWDELKDRGFVIENDRLVKKAYLN